MIKCSKDNERIKREYFRYQGEAKRKSGSTIDAYRKAILRFEEFTGFKDFKTFNKDQAIDFKKSLAITKALRTREPLSKATMLATINALKDFFVWLSWQPGYKSRIHAPDIEYFNLTDKDMSIAKARKFKPSPTIEQVKHVILTMPSDTDIQRRNRALVALALMTAMRDGALSSLRLKHIDLERGLVMQEPDSVRTKASKHINSFFYPVGDDIQTIFTDWITELRTVKHYGLNDPVFPKTKIGLDRNNGFKAVGLEPECWTTASPIRQIFRESFNAAGLPYFNPHLLRNTLTLLGEQMCQSPEQFKAWSQNMGHESPLTTFTSYGSLDPFRQGEVLKNLSKMEKKEDRLERLLGLMESRIKSDL